MRRTAWIATSSLHLVTWLVACSPAPAPPPALAGAAPRSDAIDALDAAAGPVALQNDNGQWGDAIGDPFDAAGLGLSGAGEGGGGLGEGISIGASEGATATTPSNRSGRNLGAPSIRQGATQVNGRLPPEVIQRIVRQSFGRFRLCYEGGLRSNPNLQGRIAVKLTIGTKGAVTFAVDGGSDLPDVNVVSCVVRSFGSLTFPPPESGIVTVVYPLIFNPGDGNK
jgi:hypothetical protein